MGKGTGSDRSWHFRKQLRKGNGIVSSGIDIVQVDEVGGHLVADVEVDDPVHEVEAEEGEGEQDAAPLVDVRRSYPHHLVELLRLARQDRRQRNGPGHVLLPQHTAVGTRF